MKVRRAIAIATVIASTGLIGLVGPPASAAGGPVLTAAPGNGPFDSQTQFCAKTTPPPGKRTASAPGVTANTITLADLGVDAAPLKKLGINLIDFDQMFQVFAGEINKCGGINGRKLIVKTALYNPLSSDVVAHVQGRCLKATEDFKAFMAVGIGAPPSITRCVGVQHKTIIDAPANPSEAEFKDSNGRVVSLYPSGESLAAAYIADGVAEHTFDGKTITVVGTTQLGQQQTGLMRAQYIDAFKKAGITADLEMLPCQGVSCTLQMGSAVRRMKASGTNLVVFSTSINNTNMGALVREMYLQGLKATFGGPTFGTLVAESNIPSMVAGAGSDGIKWFEQSGWTSVGTDKYGEWRDGKVKESVFARMCNDLAGKALDRAPYRYVEKDIVNGGWGATVYICTSIRAISRALYSLGNNVTTERMTAALAKVKPDRRDSAPNDRDLYYYSGTDTRPGKVLTLKFRYPCPLPTPRPQVDGCMMPADSPLRLRPVKY